MRGSHSMAAILSCAALLGAGVLTSCGGGGGDKKPTEVSASDLKKDGKFWNSLTPDLKTNLVELAQASLGKQRPDGASEIDAVPAEKGVKGMDDQYSNESKRSETISATYQTVNDAIAQQTLEGLTPGLEEGP